MKERKSRVYELVKQNGTISVERLSKLLFISPTTVRRELTQLEREGYLRRVHGGALYLPNENQEIPYDLRRSENASVKSRLAQAAASLVNDGDVVFLDSSSSVSMMVEHLALKDGLTIITNGAKTALDIGALHKFTVYVTGGRLRENSLSYTGVVARDMVGQFHADKMFFSARAMSAESGVSDVDCEEAELRRVMLERSSEHVLILEARKLNRESLYVVCPNEKVDVLITDADDALEDYDIDRVICVP